MEDRDDAGHDMTVGRGADRPDGRPEGGRGERGRGARRRIDVVGAGQASATPDVVRLQVGLRADGDDVATALRIAGGYVTAVGSAAREHGVAAADISSTGAGVHPRYDRQGQQTTGYQAFHQLAVLVRVVDDLSAVVDAFSAAAGNALSIDSISLDLADRMPLQVHAREAAFADARAKAQQYAALVGGRLGPVLSISEGVVAGPPVGRMMAAMAADSRSSMPVEAGEHTVSVTIALSFALEDA
ncbi:MAG: SIMPL domain-containing protein [Lapillicoccus sp.]